MRKTRLDHCERQDTLPNVTKSLQNNTDRVSVSVSGASWVDCRKLGLMGGKENNKELILDDLIREVNVCGMCTIEMWKAT